MSRRRRPSAKRMARMREILAAPFEVEGGSIVWNNSSSFEDDVRAQDTLQEAILLEVVVKLRTEFMDAEEEMEADFLKYLPLELKDAEARLKRALVLSALDWKPDVLASFTRAEWLEAAARAWDEAQVKSVQTA